jgi:peroxiredoxin
MTSTATIADRVGDMHAAMSDQPPNEVMGAFAREQTTLAAAGAPDGVATTGTAVPNVGLLDPYDAATDLYTVLAGRPAVVVFYRGAWCPYCNIALATYQSELLPALAERGAALVAVSPQTPDGSLSMQQKNELTFTVVSDPGNSLAAHLGILTAPSAEARAAQLKLGLDITTVNVDATTALPMPTAVIVDAEHILRWIDVHPDYSTRTEPEQILAALAGIGL